MEAVTYCKLMEEVKLRDIAVQNILNKRTTTSFPATNIDFCCLQIRKILELIALGNLVANRKMFEAQRIKFENFKKAKLILRDIEGFNPGFYPIPINEIPDPDPAIKNRLERIQEGYLTKEEFSDIYDRCSKVIHVTNPYLQEISLEEYEKDIPIWINKIHKLLNSHLIQLVNTDDLYLIHMQESDGKARAYLFGKVK